MKKIIPLLLVAVMALAMCACGVSNTKSDMPAETESIEVSEKNEATETKETKNVAEAYPVVALDNEYVTITVEGKFSNGSAFSNFGYDIVIENNCDKYVMVAPVHCSVDDFMLSYYENPHIENHTVAPNMNAKGKLFYSNNTKDNEIIKTVDDLENFYGQWQISFSENGQSWNEFEFFDFDYVLP